MANLANQRRHGDVFLHPIDCLPEGKAVSHQGEYVLAYGEVTGHAHRLRVKNPENMKVIQQGSNVFLCLMEAGTLTHEEHGTLEILPGVYRQEMEREYDYALESMRQVID